jgi:hypothetical protein
LIVVFVLVLAMLHAWIMTLSVANLVPSSIFHVAMLNVIGKISQNLIAVSVVVTAITIVMIQTLTVATHVYQRKIQK